MRPTQLQIRLLATYHAARTSMEEQGVNTLYLALGMLSWSEEDNSEKFCRAPLILIPVELERSDARDRFHLKYTGEELGENVSLAEKLKQSFGIRKFPELPEPDDLDVDAYFKKVQRAVSGQSGWSGGHGGDRSGVFLLCQIPDVPRPGPDNMARGGRHPRAWGSPGPACRARLSAILVELPRRLLAR